MSYLAALDAGVIISGGGTTPSLSEVMTVGATASTNIDMSNFTINNCTQITSNSTGEMILLASDIQLQSIGIMNIVSPILNISINGDIGTAGQVLTSTGSGLTGLEWTTVDILPLNNTFTGTNTFMGGVNVNAPLIANYTAITGITSSTVGYQVSITLNGGSGYPIVLNTSALTTFTTFNLTAGVWSLQLGFGTIGAVGNTFNCEVCDPSGNILSINAGNIVAAVIPLPSITLSCTVTVLVAGTYSVRANASQSGATIFPNTTNKATRLA